MRWQVRFLPLPDMENPFASIPQVSRLLEEEQVSRWYPLLSRSFTSFVISSVLDELRTQVGQTKTPVSYPQVLNKIEKACQAYYRKRIQKVLNGTGVILHTNMGRCPLASRVWDSVCGVNTGYSNLELELSSGKRGLRSGIIPELLQLLTGCESALVVNNNAAAVLLALTVLAKGQEVVVSRGEQIQIGGGFRIPEILALSGAKLVEVGTTNITTLEDYLSALSERTALVLVVHTSNFKIRGFTSRPSVKELAYHLPPSVTLMVDQGSGVFTEQIPGETTVRTYLEQGAHLVCCSADKVLGGPQAGIILGKKEIIHTLSRHPLMRAFRPGKTIFSLLEEVLIQRVDGTSFTEEVYSLPHEELKKFGRRILKGIPKEVADLVPALGATGGGSAPEERFRSLAIELRSTISPKELLEKLREQPIPIIGIIENEKVQLNLSTLYGENPSIIRKALFSVLSLSERGDEE
ncbi:MAG: L-seryl-tRNA(Sec) selenium transferase [Spirochaetales bacterium]